MSEHTDISTGFSIKDLFRRPQKDGPEKMPIALLRVQPGSIKRPIMTYIEPDVGNVNKRTEHGFHKSEYPLIDIGAAEDTDSFVFQAILKKLALAMKEGWTLVGQNPETVEYIKARFAQLEVAQNQTMRALIIEIMGTLLRYHNCYLIKARDIERSGGKVRTIGKKKVKPVAGYFVASPDTIEAKIGKDYGIKAYKHTMPNGRFKIFHPDDVIHIHVNKKPHFLTATPPWHPVIDDVSALRRIEEHVENLTYQHTYPLYQYKVGTETAPMQRYEDGLTEVDVVRAKLYDMPSDGMIVTPERHEIKGLGAESRALRAEVYLTHFKNRVITGTGMSQLDFGEGDTANRSTADSMSKLAVGNVKFYQQCLADAFNFEIIRELLLESTFGYNVFSEENKVEIHFTEIDHEAQIKLQNHYMLLFQSNLITRTEARTLSGWEAMSEEQGDDCHMCVVDIPQMEKQGELELHKIERQGQNQAALNAAKAKQQPTNQHKKNTGPTKRKSSRNTDQIAATIYNQLSGDLKSIRPGEINLGTIKQLFFMAESQIKRAFRPSIEAAAMQGVQDFVVTGNILARVQDVSNRVFSDFQIDVERLFRQALSKTAAELTFGERDELTIDKLQFRIRFIEKTLTHKAYILAKVAAMKENNISQAKIKSEVGGEDYPVWHNVVIDLNSITPDDLPPFHPNCQCDLIPIGDIDV